LYLEIQVLSQATFFVKDIETSGLTASAPPPSSVLETDFIHH
jgi:hypothetical protein